MQLQNNNVLITGGGSGIGAAIAQYFKNLGAKIILLDINGEAVQQQAAQIGAKAYIGDITDGVKAEQLMEQIKTECGAPRILINAAGILGSGKILGREGPMALDFFSRVLSVNLIGAFNMMRLCAAEMSKLEMMEDGERGLILNIGSIAAEEGQIGQAAYSASKAGLAGLTLPAARELARFGIRVVTLAPGLVETNMLSGLSDDAKQALADSIPFPKRLAKPVEIAKLAHQIVENVMINGSVIRIDGALRMTS